MSGPSGGVRSSITGLPLEMQRIFDGVVITEDDLIFRPGSVGHQRDRQVQGCSVT